MLLSETRLGANDPGLPAAVPLPPLSTALSRRAALFGAVSVAGVSVAVAAPAAVPTSDAALIDLARQIEVLAAREHEAWMRHAAAEDAVFASTPPAPVRRDVPRPFEDMQSLTIGAAVALFGSAAHRAASDAADAEHRGALAEQARVVEAIEKRHGLPRLERQAKRATAEVTVASAEIAGMTAATPAGLTAKARVLLAVSGKDPLSRWAEAERHDALLQSLLADAVRLGAGALS